jgi:hypothetical protein
VCFLWICRPLTPRAAKRQGKPLPFAAHKQTQATRQALTEGNDSNTPQTIEQPSNTRKRCAEFKKWTEVMRSSQTRTAHAINLDNRWRQQNELNFNDRNFMPMPLQKEFDIAQETQNNRFPFLPVFSVKVVLFITLLRHKTRVVMVNRVHAVELSNHAWLLRNSCFCSKRTQRQQKNRKT